MRIEAVPRQRSKRNLGRMFLQRMRAKNRACSRVKPPCLAGGRCDVLSIECYKQNIAFSRSQGKARNIVPASNAVVVPNVPKIAAEVEELSCCDLLKNELDTRTRALTEFDRASGRGARRSNTRTVFAKPFQINGMRTQRHSS